MHNTKHVHSPSMQRIYFFLRVYSKHFYETELKREQKEKELVVFQEWHWSDKKRYAWNVRRIENIRQAKEAHALLCFKKKGLVSCAKWQKQREMK